MRLRLLPRIGIPNDRQQICLQLPRAALPESPTPDLSLGYIQSGAYITLGVLPCHAVLEHNDGVPCSAMRVSRRRAWRANMSRPEGDLETCLIPGVFSQGCPRGIQAEQIF